MVDGSDNARHTLRKGARTQAQLIEATIQVLGRVGYEAASVVEITKAAKVSNATFYLYFKNKEQVIDVAIFQVADELMRRIREEELSIADPVERAVHGIRLFLARVLENPAWARAMLAVHLAVPELRAHMHQYGQQNLWDGIASGAFDIQGTPLQIEGIHAMIMTTVRLQLEGLAGPHASDECIDLMLRMLGAKTRRSVGATGRGTHAHNGLPKNMR